MARNALLSVYDKTGIEDFARALRELDFNLYSSGGTAKKLTEAGIEVTDVATLVGGAAILGHKVVTLSREVHAGLLADYDGPDLEEMERLGLPYMDLVCVDLYPLQDEIAKPDSTPESVRQQTDIGGPTMLRSAAKGRRVVISDPAQRQAVLLWLQDPYRSDDFRVQLAAYAEFIVACYTAASAQYLSDGLYSGLLGEQVLTVKYGENAWMVPASLYKVTADDPLAIWRFRPIAGTDPSLNNIIDIDRLVQTATHIAAGFERNLGSVPLVAIGGKHGNACCTAEGADPVDVAVRSYKGDPRAMFGGLMLFNYTLTAEVAEALKAAGASFDGVVAPEITDEAIEVLTRKGNKCRFYVNPALAELTEASLATEPRFRPVRGSFLKQPNYTFVLDFNYDSEDEKLKPYWAGEWTEQQKRDIILAWAIGSTSNSNTITLVRDGMLIGNGVGQQDRVGCCDVALKRANDAGHYTAVPDVVYDVPDLPEMPRLRYHVDGAVAYSDSFFPYEDGPQRLIESGVSGIFATYGSIRDKYVRAAIEEAGVALWQLPDAVARGFFGH